MIVFKLIMINKLINKKEIYYTIGQYIGKNNITGLY